MNGGSIGTTKRRKQMLLNNKNKDKYGRLRRPKPNLLALNPPNFQLEFFRKLKAGRNFTGFARKIPLLFLFSKKSLDKLIIACR